MSMPPPGHKDEARAPAPKSAALVLLLVMIAAAGLVLSRSGVFSRQKSQPPASVAKPMSTAEVDALLRDWTYPGAKDTTSTLVLPALLGTVANPWPKYVYRFTIPEPPVMVRRFYAAKLSMNPTVGSGFSGADIGVPYYVTAYANELQHALETSPEREAEIGTFSRRTKDYMIEAMISHGANPRQTQVILFLAPFQIPDS